MKNQRVEMAPTGTKRIEYIDALRGFTMFLVVVMHVGGSCFGIFPFWLLLRQQHYNHLQEERSLDFYEKEKYL